MHMYRTIDRYQATGTRDSHNDQAHCNLEHDDVFMRMLRSYGVTYDAQLRLRSVGSWGPVADRERLPGLAGAEGNSACSTP